MPTKYAALALGGLLAFAVPPITAEAAIIPAVKAGASSIILAKDKPGKCGAMKYFETKSTKCADAKKEKSKDAGKGKKEKKKIKKKKNKKK